jgi:hypothetical protein
MLGLLAGGALALLGSAGLVALRKVRWVDRWRAGGAGITTRTYVVLVGGTGFLVLVLALVGFVVPSKTALVVYVVSLPVVFVLYVLIVRAMRTSTRRSRRR